MKKSLKDYIPSFVLVVLHYCQLVWRQEVVAYKTAAVQDRLVYLTEKLEKGDDSSIVPKMVHLEVKLIALKAERAGLNQELDNFWRPKSQPHGAL